MHVLISGAGIAGPTLAWFLAKTGARITVVEKAPALFPHGQNVDIQGSARNVIRKMGLMEEVRRHNTTEKGTQFIDPKGRPFAPLPVKDPGKDTGRAASPTSQLEILRGDLAAILYNATKDHPRTDYLFGTTVTQVLSNDEKSVKLELSNGNVEEFDLLVAADGQWSKLRKQIFAPGDVQVVDKGMYAVYYTIPRVPGDNDWWNVYSALGSRIITTRPDPYGGIRAMFTHMPSTAAQKDAWQRASRSDRKTQQELLRSTFADAGWQAQRLLDNMDQASDWYFQAIQQIRMMRWSNNRVICLGDTAFAPTPLTGMGTSLAILGAYVLAGELSKLKDNEHPRIALGAYERSFRPFVEESQQIPPFIPSIAHPDVAWKRFLLRTAIRSIAAIVSIPWVANRESDNGDEEDFSLPVYQLFEDSAVEKA